MIAKTTAVLLILAGLLIGCTSNQSAPGAPSAPDAPNFQQHYDAHDVHGSFVLYDLQDETYTTYNNEQLDKPFTPASTFKVCNSLIGIETRIIEDQNFVIKWDSVPRQNPKWNKDTDLKEALKNSTVWYYQELATRVGADTMHYWLNKLEYGNADISGGLTTFWLTGGLRITPNQQIDFLTKLVRNNLPLSQRTMDIVKDMMVLEETPDYTLSGKTGWGTQHSQDIGWFVGFVESNGRTYVFANCIQTHDPTNPHFAKARIDIVSNILTDLGLIPDQRADATKP